MPGLLLFFALQAAVTPTAAPPQTLATDTPERFSILVPVANEPCIRHVDGKDWLSAPIAASTTPTTISTPLNAAQCSGEGTHALTVDIYVTGDSFPVRRTITAVTSVRSS